jgi:hypothetical protein
MSSLEAITYDGWSFCPRFGWQQCSVEGSTTDMAARHNIQRNLRGEDESWKNVRVPAAHHGGGGRVAKRAVCFDGVELRRVVRQIFRRLEVFRVKAPRPSRRRERRSAEMNDSLADHEKLQNIFADPYCFARRESAPRPECVGRLSVGMPKTLFKI